MRMTVLVDNNTLIDQYFRGEPAVCYLLEDGDHTILFDTGYSGLFLENAAQCGEDLNRISMVVLSHGHNDHTGGLPYLLDAYRGEGLTLVGHPDVFEEKTENGAPIGSPLSKEEAKARCRLLLSDQPVRLTQRLTFLGEIPAYHAFEPRCPIGQRLHAGRWEADFVPDDSALAYQSGEGLVIITGCSHSGICNLIEHAKAVCGETRVRGVIGGFHLFEDDEQTAMTSAYFQLNHIELLFPCHCVSFAAKARLHRAVPIGEVGVGMRLEW